MASTFASIDACITALTTAFSYDFMDIESKPHEQKKKIKNRVLLGVNLVMFMIAIQHLLEQPGRYHQYDFQDSRVYLWAYFRVIFDRGCLLMFK